ncbi:uncharacterized protein CLUP02_10830 [Colletotrichum lupini]|uniref:Uncharacterized protein n=1 Tax=Colletotrichum lupini TaxID=145971 RepID=A0A9Q8SXH4_9PEZI|nr:uncharacterized protein CLUP02_10830 [Colletotrichum lupini]UQC85333.1 hypothetical protein CLUP02_10830 [Colletotrichum lupini]
MPTIDDGLFDGRGRSTASGKIVEIWLERRPMARRGKGAGRWSQGDDLQSPLTKKRRGKAAEGDASPERQGHECHACPDQGSPCGRKRGLPGTSMARTAPSAHFLPSNSNPTYWLYPEFPEAIVDLPIGGEWTCVWGPALASFLLGTVQSSITKEWRNKLPITIPSSVPGAVTCISTMNRDTDGDVGIGTLREYLTRTGVVGIENIRFPAEHDEVDGNSTGWIGRSWAVLRCHGAWAGKERKAFDDNTLTLQVVPTLIGTCPPVGPTGRGVRGSGGQWKKEAIHLAYLSELGTYRNQERIFPIDEGRNMECGGGRRPTSLRAASRKPQAAAHHLPASRPPPFSPTTVKSDDVSQGRAVVSFSPNFTQQRLASFFQPVSLCCHL